MSDTTEDCGQPSGRFVLRIRPALHARLRAEAAEAGVSLNEYCARTLEGVGPVEEGPASDAVIAARRVFGRDLLAVVAYGSWARGEAVDGSDVDVLLVLAPETRVTRALYRRWDGEAQDWGDRPLEAHIWRCRRSARG